MDQAGALGEDMVQGFKNALEQARADCPGQGSGHFGR